MAQVAAAALAAVTTAVLGSRVGTAGTLIGAAGASVLTTVGTAVYKASLERSREKVRTLARRTRSLPSSLEGTRTECSHSVAANSSLGDEQLTGSTRRAQPWGRSRRFATLGWGAVVVGALGAFVLAMMVITGFEWASGEAVGGNGKGTTIGQVVSDPPAPRQPAAPSESHTPAGPVSQTPSAPDTTTTTTTPDGGLDVELSPTETSESPAPSEVTPTPPLIPSELPGIGD